MAKNWNDNGKICSKCKKYLEYNNFDKNKHHSSGHYSSCKKCRIPRYKRYYAKHREDCIVKTKKYREKRKDFFVLYAKKWRIANKEKVNNYAAKRRVLTKVLSKEQSAIEAIYKKAKELTEKTGVKYEVDHIIPIACPFQGLHVLSNLQILTQKENRSKGTRFKFQDLSYDKIQNKELLFFVDLISKLI